MRLGEAQETFAELLPNLLIKIYASGYKARLGDLFRDPRSHGEFGEKGVYGRSNSQHKNKCAIDINLISPEGEYLSATDDHKDFGEYWETLHPHCRWGGRYNDGNHYEFIPQGWRNEYP